MITYDETENTGEEAITIPSWHFPIFEEDQAVQHCLTMEDRTARLCQNVRK